MQYVCDAAGGKAWFRIETEGEAAQESLLMQHSVERYFRREKEQAAASYQPASQSFIERDIGLKARIARHMAIFLTLRDSEGNGLATAMLPPAVADDPAFRIIIVGPANADPYPKEAEAIAALGRHYGLSLTRDRCFPYK